MENNNKEESREFYVYKHIRKDNNTCFYVGKGKGRRMYVPKRNKHFNRIRKKYGCYVVKIKENLTEKEAFALEREIIEDYVFVFGYGINIKGYYKGYNENEHLTNCTWGGEGTSGMHHSEKTKQNMSEKAKGRKQSEEAKQKNSEAHKGVNPYANKTEEEMEETRRKKSESMKGKNKGEKSGMWGKQPYNKGKKGLFHHSEEAKLKIGVATSKKVVCITTGKKFDSQTDASDWYNVPISCISRCCKGTRKHAGKLPDGTPLEWKYSEDDDNNLKVV